MLGRSDRVYPIISGVMSERIALPTHDGLALTHPLAQAGNCEAVCGYYSPRTVQYLHVVIHKALKQALRWAFVVRDVAEAVDPPRVPK